MRDRPRRSNPAHLTAHALEELERMKAQIVYGEADGANSVAVAGATTSVTLPAIIPVVSGDYCAILEQGADRLIIGPVGGTIGGGVEVERDANGSSWVAGLTNLSSAESDYTYVGGPDTGDGGLLFYRGSASVTGTPTYSNPRVLLPSGFNFGAEWTSTYQAIPSWVTGVRSTTAYTGALHYYSTSAALIKFNMQLASSVAHQTMAAGVPITWTSGDSIRWSMTAPVVRV